MEFDEAIDQNSMPKFDGTLDKRLTTITCVDGGCKIGSSLFNTLLECKKATSCAL